MPITTRRGGIINLNQHLAEIDNKAEYCTLYTVLLKNKYILFFCTALHCSLV